MAQLVGQNCVVCRKAIDWVGNGRFCRACRSPVHNACATAPTDPTTERRCHMCGAEGRVVARPGVNSFWLTREGDQSGDKWLLEWDDATLVLTGPAGRAVLTTSVDRAHRVVEFNKLFFRSTISFPTAQRPWTFEWHMRAAKAMRTLVAAGLRSDPDYRALLERRELWYVVVGLVLSVIGMSSYGLSLYFAIGYPDPPPGHWLHRWGWLLTVVFSSFMVMAFGGPVAALVGFLRWRRIRRFGYGPGDAE